MCDFIDIRPIAKRIVDLSQIAFDLGIYCNPIGNFSLLPFNGKYYLATFRLFGYYITSEMNSYVFTDNMRLEKPDEHLFLLLDKDFNLVRRLNLIENTYYKPDEFQGQRTYLEDGRLVSWEFGIYLTSSTFYTNSDKWEKMGIEVQKIRISDDEVSARHTWNSCEHGIMGRHKNWMPIPDKPFQYVFATYDHGVNTIDVLQDMFSVGGVMDEDCLYRGNTPLLKTDFGYMTITHRLDFDENNRKVYLNHFVEYNADLSIRRISRPFKLCERNIEFVTAFLELPDDRIIIGVTEMDDTPLVMEFDKNELVSKVM